MNLLVFREVESKQLVHGARTDLEDTLPTAGFLVDPVSF
jgi:hypothetical protein